MPDTHPTDMRLIAVTCVLLLPACETEFDDAHADKSRYPSRVDSCDLRAVFGTCVEYTLSELDE